MALKMSCSSLSLLRLIEIERKWNGISTIDSAGVAREKLVDFYLHLNNCTQHTIDYHTTSTRSICLSSPNGIILHTIDLVLRETLWAKENAKAEAT